MQTDDEREKMEIEKRERMKKEHWKNMEVGNDDCFHVGLRWLQLPIELS